MRDATAIHKNPAVGEELWPTLWVVDCATWVDGLKSKPCCDIGRRSGEHGRTDRVIEVGGVVSPRLVGLRHVLVAPAIRVHL